jgi:hypothetical protein
LHLTWLRRAWRLSRGRLHLTWLTGRGLLLLRRLWSRRLAGSLRRLLFFVGLRRRLRHDVAWIENGGVDGHRQNCRQYCPSQETFFCVGHQDLIFRTASKDQNTK